MNAAANPQPTPIDKRVIAQEFAARAKGKLKPTQIDSIVEALVADTAAYPAAASFFPKIQVAITGGETFHGGPGGVPGTATGDVYTESLAALYGDTVSYEYQGTPIYLSILFFDSSSKLLGHFQGVPTSVVIGVGGGGGHWS